MRFRLMATYLGVPYQAGLGPDGTDVTLFSPGPPPEELGFTASGGYWRKQVGVMDLDALWQSRPVGEYREEPCLVLDDLGARLHIAYLGRDTTRAIQLGYWEIDREVFEVVVARQDVTGLTEDRVDFPLAAAMFPPSGDAHEIPPDPSVAPEAAQASSEAAGSVALEADPGPLPGGPASRTPDRAAAWHGSPWPEPWPEPEPWLEPGSWREPGPGNEPGQRAEPASWIEPAPLNGAGHRAERATTLPPGRRGAGKDRVTPQSAFAELLSLASISQASYAVNEEVPGAMCLVKADGGFEVFSCTDEARLEVRFFEDEEAAYFYLFGVLAAEAIRSGRLGPRGPRGPGRANGRANGSRGISAPSASTQNVSKYLHGRKLPESRPLPASVE